MIKHWQFMYTNIHSIFTINTPFFQLKKYVLRLVLCVFMFFGDLYFVFSCFGDLYFVFFYVLWRLVFCVFMFFGDLYFVFSYSLETCILCFHILWRLVFCVFMFFGDLYFVFSCSSETCILCFPIHWRLGILSFFYSLATPILCFLALWRLVFCVPGGLHGTNHSPLEQALEASVAPLSYHGNHFPWHVLWCLSGGWDLNYSAGKLV